MYSMQFFYRNELFCNSYTALNSVIRNNDLSQSERNYLSNFISKLKNRKGKIDLTENRWDKQSTIATELGLSKRTIIRLEKSLKSKGYLISKRLHRSHRQYGLFEIGISKILKVVVNLTRTPVTERLILRDRMMQNPVTESPENRKTDVVNHIPERHVIATENDFRSDTMSLLKLPKMSLLKPEKTAVAIGNDSNNRTNQKSELKEEELNNYISTIESIDNTRYYNDRPNPSLSENCGEKISLENTGEQLPEEISIPIHAETTEPEISSYQDMPDIQNRTIEKISKVIEVEKRKTTTMNQLSEIPVSSVVSSADIKGLSNDDLVIANMWANYAKSIIPNLPVNIRAYSRAIVALKARYGLNNSSIAGALKFASNDKFWRDKMISPIGLLNRSRNGLTKWENFYIQAKKIIEPKIESARNYEEYKKIMGRGL